VEDVPDDWQGVVMPAPVPPQASAPPAAQHVEPGTQRAAVLGCAGAVAPEAFGADRLVDLGTVPGHGRYPASS
jgi:hypothetical protein